MARKPNPISLEEINMIKSDITSQGEIAIEHAVDCKKLSYHIFNITGEYISVSTLKRFFGFTKSDFAPAYDTIKILKQYALHFKKIDKGFSPANFIINFFEPLHFEKIKHDDKSFHAACRNIALQLKENVSLLQEVMDTLAESENGRRFYFDLFPDYDLLKDVQYKGYEKYLLYEKSYEGKMFANCILFLKAFFSEDLKLMKKIGKTVAELFDKKKNLHPFVLGRYYQVQLIANDNFDKAAVKNIWSEIIKTEKNISRNDSGLFREFPGFHYFVCDGLWHTKAFDELLQISTIALNDFKKHDEFVWKGYYSQLYLYRGLALVNLNRKDEAIKTIKNINADSFYFPTRNYFKNLYSDLMLSIK